MANPTQIDDKPVVLEVTTVESSIVLDPDRDYTCVHSGEDTSGNPVTNTAYLSSSAGVDADASEGDDKAKLLDGGSITVGPGWKALYFATEAGAPTMTVVPSGLKGGNW